METRACVICGDNYAPRRSNQVTCRKASCLLANRNRCLKEARSNVAAEVAEPRVAPSTPGDSLRRHSPLPPFPSVHNPQPVQSTAQSIPTGQSLDLILDEVRALLNLPHVLAVSITREGKVTALRGLPSEEDADDKAEAERQCADFGVPSFEVR